MKCILMGFGYYNLTEKNARLTFLSLTREDYNLMKKRWNADNKEVISYKEYLEDVITSSKPVTFYLQEKAIAELIAIPVPDDFETISEDYSKKIINSRFLFKWAIEHQIKYTMILTDIKELSKIELEELYNSL